MNKEEKKQLARAKLEERKKKENAKYMKLFGIIPEEEPVIMDLETIYGYAFIEGSKEKWFYHTGSFPYLYGKHEGISNIKELWDEDEDEDEGEGSFYMNHVFFILDSKQKPVKLLTEIIVPAELAPLIGQGGGKMKYDVELRDLTVIENFDVPEFDPEEF